MIINLIDQLNQALNTIVNIRYNITEYSELIPSLVKLCTDKILEIEDDSIKKEHKDFGDIEINYDDKFYKINIKTQNVDKTYSFPNLISIKKAKDILMDHTNNILYIFVEYEYKDDNLKITKISVQNIESLDWTYLYIQNLGKGQLQVKNMSKDEFKFKNDVTRTQWLNILKEKGIEYYDSLMLKVVEYKSEWENE